jgi:hypothetical protein
VAGHLFPVYRDVEQLVADALDCNHGLQRSFVWQAVSVGFDHCTSNYSRRACCLTGRLSAGGAGSSAGVKAVRDRVLA